MTFLSYVASCLTDPWVIGPLAVVALIFGWTCIPYDDQKKSQSRGFGQPDSNVTVPQGSRRAVQSNHIGEFLIDDIGALARMKADRRVH